MKVFSVVGFSKTGKTTTIENIIKELKRRKYTVGSVKEIHYEHFALDKEGTNTYRHHEAGAEPVTARSGSETDILYRKKLDMNEILKFYSNDFVILEGVRDFNVPKIMTCKDIEEISEKLDGSVFLISGLISDKMDNYMGRPIIDSTKDIAKMVDIIEEKVFRLLPNMSEECCGACGYSCREMVSMILSGEKKREDCIIEKDEAVSLLIDGKRIKMVPFVQKILRNLIEGMVSELHGYRKNSEIDIKIRNRE